MTTVKYKISEGSIPSITRANRGTISASAITEDQELLCSTEIYLNEAASYSIYIRPVNSQTDLFEGSTNTAKVAKLLNRVFAASTNTEDLKLTLNSFSNSVIKSYLMFLDEVITSDIELDISWYNPSNHEGFKNCLTPHFAKTVKEEYSKFSSSFNQNLVLKGRFNRLHTDTGYFSFISTDQESFTGYFEKLVRESMSEKDFINQYEIQLLQKTTKEIGKTENTVENTLTSCIKLIEE